MTVWVLAQGGGWQSTAQAGCGTAFLEAKVATTNLFKYGQVGFQSGGGTLRFYRYYEQVIKNEYSYVNPTTTVTRSNRIEQTTDWGTITSYSTIGGYAGCGSATGVSTYYESQSSEERLTSDGTLRASCSKSRASSSDPFSPNCDPADGNLTPTGGTYHADAWTDSSRIYSITYTSCQECNSQYSFNGVYKVEESLSNEYTTGEFIQNFTNALAGCLGDPDLPWSCGGGAGVYFPLSQACISGSAFKFRLRYFARAGVQEDIRIVKNCLFGDFLVIFHWAG